MVARFFGVPNFCNFFPILSLFGKRNLKKFLNRRTKSPNNCNLPPPQSSPTRGEEIPSLLCGRGLGRGEMSSFKKLSNNFNKALITPMAALVEHLNFHLQKPFLFCFESTVAPETKRP